MLQYNSPENTTKKLERLPNFKGKTEIQRCIGFLIKFVYEEIATQRRYAIEAMEEACIKGLEQDGSQKFKEFIDLYMNSKYAGPQYLPSDTKNGLDADFETVEKYMDLVKSEIGEINNLKHLRGAATRLLVQRPDNFVFILLKSFTVILLEKENKEFIKEAQNDFLNGFLKVMDASQEDITSVRQKIYRFKQKLSNFDVEAPKLIEVAENAFYLKLHSNWLKTFNNKFINIQELCSVNKS